MSSDIYDITIPIRTMTANQLLRSHWRKRRKQQNDIAWMVRAEAIPPAVPFDKARVTIYRYTTGKMDEDGQGMIAKGILDVLQPCSKVHPLGLGFIKNDGPDCLELLVHTIHSTAKATRIVIKKL